MANFTLMRGIVLAALFPIVAFAANPSLQPDPPNDDPQPAAAAGVLNTGQATAASAAVTADPAPPDPLSPVTAASIRAAAPAAAAGNVAHAPPGPAADIDERIDDGMRVEFRNRTGDHKQETALALRIVLGLTLLGLVPAILVSLTGFLRIIIVLSMLRHALGTQETPPNTVLIGLALFLTLFTMSPVLQRVNQDAFQPFMDGKIGMQAAYEKGIVPVRGFMVRQTREQDLALMVELSKAPRPATIEDVSNVQLIPAFMLSELRTAFQIGFVIFLPFLLIDLIVSSILMGLGMMMMPPISISLPLKILMFVLVDGWSLVLRALMGSFH